MNKRYYKNLYDFQFTERYKKSKKPIISLEEIAADQSKRVRIRELLHR